MPRQPLAPHHRQPHCTGMPRQVPLPLFPHSRDILKKGWWQHPSICSSCGCRVEQFPGVLQPVKGRPSSLHPWHAPQPPGISQVQLADWCPLSAEIKGKLTPAKGKQKGEWDQLPLLQSLRDGNSREGRRVAIWQPLCLTISSGFYKNPVMLALLSPLQRRCSSPGVREEQAEEAGCAPAGVCSPVLCTPSACSRGSKDHSPVVYGSSLLPTPSFLGLLVLSSSLRSMSCALAFSPLPQVLCPAQPSLSLNMGK